MEQDEAAQAFQEFVRVIKALRTPGTGCPWDLEQDHRTLRPYLIEEAYEVLDAIDRADDRDLRDELGDVLLQVVLHAQVAADRGAFVIADVVRGITEKMVRRHPHVFGDVRVSGSDEVKQNWEQIKAAERQAEDKSPVASEFRRIPKGLPALLRAQQLGEAADRLVAPVGGYFAELRKELEGVEAETCNESNCDAAESLARRERQFGNLFFSLCQLARQLGVNAEARLQAANARFSKARHAADAEFDVPPF
jgi:MazG family protein